MTVNLPNDWGVSKLNPNADIEEPLELFLRDYISKHYPSRTIQELIEVNDKEGLLFMGKQSNRQEEEKMKSVIICRKVFFNDGTVRRFAIGVTQNNKPFVFYYMSSEDLPSGLNW